MMTAVAGHRNKEVMMTMVAKIMRTMAQISRMCLGSRTSTGDWLIASMVAPRSDPDPQSGLQAATGAFLDP